MRLRPRPCLLSESYFLIDLPGARVECLNLESFSVKTKLVYAMPQNQLGRLTAKPWAGALGTKESAEAAGAIQLSLQSLSTTSPTIASVP